MNKAGLAVAVGRLIEVHEVHVDFGPRQIAAKLGVQMQERLAQLRQAADPHLGRRKRVHPQDQPGTVGAAVGLDAQLADLVGRLEHRLKNDLDRQGASAVERLHDVLGIGRDLVEGRFAV